MPAYETKWELVREALILLHRLQEGPADRAELILAVQAALPTAFTQPTADAQRRHFERVLAALRERLLVDVEWDPSAQAYILNDVGPYLAQTLSGDQLQGLAFLLETFGKTDARTRRIVQPFLEHVRETLKPEQRKFLDRQYPIFSVKDLSRSSLDHIDQAIWDKAQAAVKQHRVIRFDYLNTKHEDRLPRTHTAEPYEIVFRDGHTYLQAFCREWTHPDGFSGGGKWHTYRLDYIQPKSLSLLPQVFSAETRTQRLLTVRYKVAPQIGQGNMAQHFEAMEIEGTDEDGWVTVVGKTPNLFEAYRTLLQLGALCIALHPPDLVGMMRDAAASMTRHYPLKDPKEMSNRKDQ